MINFRVLLVVLIFQLNGFSQVPAPPLQKGWKRVYVKNVGSIALPETLAVPAKKYKSFTDPLTGISGFDSNEIVALSRKALKSEAGESASVTLLTTITTPGDYRKLYASKMNSQEVEDLNNLTKKSQQGNKEETLVQWYPLRSELIYGMPCQHYKYVRHKKSSPNEMVNIYCFQNDDRMHQITLIYRMADEKIWKDNFSGIINSFTISNVR